MFLNLQYSLNQNLTGRVIFCDLTQFTGKFQQIKWEGVNNLKVEGCKQFSIPWGL